MGIAQKLAVTVMHMVRKEKGPQSYNDEQEKVFSILIAQSSSLEVTISWCVSTNIFYILANRYMCTFVFFQNLTDFKMTF